MNVRSQLVKNFLAKLVENGCIDAVTASIALQQTTSSSVWLVANLVQNHGVDSSKIARALAEHLGLPLCDVSQYSKHAVPSQTLDIHFIQKHQILPLCVENQQLHIAIVDPCQIESLSEIRFHTQLSVQAFAAEYHPFMRELNDFITKQQNNTDFNPGTQMDHDSAAIDFVQQLLNDAVKKNASDIHIEPEKNAYRTRLRIDGILHEGVSFNSELAQRVVARFKIISKLDISERRLPQDGRFSFESVQHDKDCRVSTCPTQFGEKIVVRILDSNPFLLNMDELGMSKIQKKLFSKILHSPQGLSLVTGPTGSGKTVTLYTALHLLNTPQKNISTVEDPIEIRLAGINQVNVNTKIGLSFALTLRTFLRQDPDIMMVGEIRDQETAEIAIKAAQTGHFVLSTLHTNSAAETIIRLLNIGIPSFNIASSVRLIIAQRLVRKLCNYCKKPQKITREKEIELGLKNSQDEQVTLYLPQHCAHCTKGYHGRVGVFEFLPITDEISGMVMLNKPIREIMDYAKHIGMQTLKEAALEKIKNGMTSINEIQRVLSF